MLILPIGILGDDNMTKMLMQARAAGIARLCGRDIGLPLSSIGWPGAAAISLSIPIRSRPPGW